MEESPKLSVKNRAYNVLLPLTIVLYGLTLHQTFMLLEVRKALFVTGFTLVYGVVVYVLYRTTRRAAR